MVASHLTNKARFIRVMFLFFILIIPLSNIGRGLYNQINANDFSIYQQAIYDIADGVSLNPYLTIRSANIFNDHADPALILATPFVKIFGYHQNVLYFAEWFFFIATLIFVFWGTRKLKITQEVNDFTYYILPFLLFSRSILQGLEFPIHPTTWSIFPLALLFYSIKINSLPKIILSSLFLMTFRESLPFAVMAISIYYLINRKWGHFLSLFLIGVLFFSLLTIVRPIVLGPVVNYGQTLMRDFFQNPFSLFFSRLKTFSWPIKELFPPTLFFLFFLFVKFKGQKKELLRNNSLIVIFFIAPIFFLHLLSNYLVHHHSIPIAVPLILFPLLSRSFLLFLKGNKKVYIFLLALFIGTASSRYTKMVKSVLIPPYSQEVIKERFKSLDKITKSVENLPQEAKIMATGGIIPQIMAPRKKIYQFVEITPKDLTVDYLLLELNYHGDLNPIAIEDVLRIKERCLKNNPEIVYEDQFFILMKGSFNDCLGIKEMWPYQSTLLPR